MVRRKVFLVSFCAFAVSVSALVAALAADGKSPETPSEQIQKLQERIAQLEARIKALEQKQPCVVLPSNVAVPKGLTLNEPLPKGWQQREFNGRPYYVVPLDKN